MRCTIRKVGPAAVLLVLLSELSACSGGGSHDGLSESALGPVLYLEHEGLGAPPAEEAVVHVAVAGITGLYGAALDLVYDPDLLGYRSASPGPFLHGDGHDVAFAAALEDGLEGRLVTGVSKVGDVPGFDGAGGLMTVRFAVKCVDCPITPIKVERARLKASDLSDIAFGLR